MSKNFNNNRKHSLNLGRIVLSILPIIWMIVIFCFSAQLAEESTEAGEFVVKIINFLLGHNIISSSSVPILMGLSIRKIAHVTEYFILTILCFGAIRVNVKNGETINKDYLMTSRNNILIQSVLVQTALAAIISYAYSCTDEFHQLFVPGRWGCFTDTLIDGIGMLIAVILILIIYKISSEFSRGRNSEDE